MLKKITQSLASTLAVIAGLLISPGLFAQRPQISGAVAEQIASGLNFSEGPLWLDGVGLIFSDVRANTVMRYDTASRTVQPYFMPSGNSNGLALDKAGNLLLAQHGTRGISRRVNGQLIAIDTTYLGKKLNSPNDLVVNSRNSIYFTDPNYGITTNQKQLSFQGIFRINPYGTLQLLDSTFTSPNGLAFSPDEKLLYVNESETKTIYVFDVVNDSTLSGKRVFFQFPSTGTGNADGMKVDSSGFVYSTGPYGIWIISPQKVVIDTILIPGSATNVGFGNYDRKTLYITAGPLLFKAVNNPVTGLEDDMTNTSATLLGTYTDAQANTLHIPVVLNQSGSVKLEIRSLTGISIATVAQESMAAGKKIFTWNFDHVSDGIYMVHLTQGDRSYVCKTALQKK